MTKDDQARARYEEKRSAAQAVSEDDPRALEARLAMHTTSGEMHLAYSRAMTPVWNEYNARVAAAWQEYLKERE